MRGERRVREGVVKDRGEKRPSRLPSPKFLEKGGRDERQGQRPQGSRRGLRLDFRLPRIFQ